MPNSKLEVATTQGSSPAFSSRSTCSRFSLETEPWWAFAMTTAGSVTNAVVEPMSERKLAPGAPRMASEPVGTPRTASSPKAVASPLPAAAQKPATSEMGRVQTEALRVQLVQPRRQLLAQTARVHEDDGGFMGQHLVENGRLDMRPDRGAAQAAVRMRRGRGALGHDGPKRPVRLPRVLDRRPARTGAPLPRAVAGAGKSPEGGNGRHVAHRHAHRKVEARERFGGHHGHRMRTAEEPGYFVARAHRGRQPDALGRSLQQIVQPLPTKATDAPLACRRPGRAPRPR